MQEVLDQIHTRNLSVIFEALGMPHNPGRRKALCPFHDEKTPSFSWKGGVFNCFGCGEKGDAITFLRKYESLGFVDAVRRCCEIYGIAFKDRPPKRNYYLEAINENYQILKAGIEDELFEAYSMIRCYGRRIILTKPLQHEAKWFSRLESLHDKIDHLEDKSRELERARRNCRRTA